MKRVLLVLVISALLVSTLAVGPALAAPKGKLAKAKVPICHNVENNPHTIVVAPSAVPAHLAHGDILGVCPPLPLPV